MIARSTAGRLGLLGSLLVGALALGGCQNKEAATNNDEMKKSLDQLVQTSKETSAQTRDVANSSKANGDALKALASRVDEMHKDVAAALAKQKRGALALTLDVETTCENDPQCTNTARAVCNKINYPNAITSRFTPGVRPVLNSLICFD